mgnify:CR=1 FL=1
MGKVSGMCFVLVEVDIFETAPPAGRIELLKDFRDSGSRANLCHDGE